jgi:putative ubiquitin-RnfH superfamily antitoxin RatB of RatAB toxin-antitoxin module
VSAATVTVRVAWATPDVQDVVVLTLPAGTSAGEAIARSGLVERYRVDVAGLRLGIDGRLVREETVLAEGDRLELLRPLAIDPKDARRLRAEVRARGRAPGKDPAAR